MDTTEEELAFLHQFCQGCECQNRTKKAFPRCSGCKIVFYCSRACQKANWSHHHKKHCRRQQVDIQAMTRNGHENEFLLLLEWVASATAALAPILLTYYGSEIMEQAQDKYYFLLTIAFDYNIPNRPRYFQSLISAIRRALTVYEICMHMNRWDLPLVRCSLSSSLSAIHGVK
jgi:hypothetical protein